MSTDAFDETTLAPLPHLSIQAFCVTADVAYTLDDAAQDRRLARVYYTRHDGGMEGAIATFQTAPTPNLMVLETVETREQVLANLDRLADICDPGTKVIVVGHVNDVVLYRELLKRGVSEYLVQPFHAIDFVRALAEIYGGEKATPIGRLIGFFGARGGIGTSTICHNIAAATAKVFQREVVIADLDLPFGTAALDFNIDPPQGISEALVAPDKVDPVFLDRLMAQCSTHVRLLAAPTMLDQTYDLQEYGGSEIFSSLRRMVPYTFLDLPHGWTAFLKRALSDCDDVVLVTSPDLTGLRNVKALVDQFARLRSNDRAAYLLLSGVGVPKRPEISIEDFKRALGQDLAGVIPFDPGAFGAAANEGRLLYETAPKSSFGRIVEDMAFRLGGKTPQPDKNGGSLFGAVLSRLTGGR